MTPEVFAQANARRFATPDLHARVSKAPNIPVAHRVVTGSMPLVMASGHAANLSHLSRNGATDAIPARDDR
jgi:hypothetical protein